MEGISQDRRVVVSRWAWLLAAVVAAAYFAWRLATTGELHHVLSVIGFLAVVPFGWLRPVNLFRPVSLSVATPSDVDKRSSVAAIAALIGFFLVLVGAGIREFAP